MRINRRAISTKLASPKPSSECASAGGRATFVKADVNTCSRHAAHLDTASRIWPLDILHNHAGIGVVAPGFPDSPPERWQLVI